MSAQQIKASEDILRLEQEGYHVVLVKGAIALTDIPYVKRDKSIGYCTIWSAMPLAGDIPQKPTDHTIVVLEDTPCDEQGSPMQKLVIGNMSVNFGGRNYQGHRCSQRPVNDHGQKVDYEDWFHKMSTYASLISRPAQAISPGIRPNPGQIPLANPKEEVFVYPNNAPARNGTTALVSIFENLRIGILGLGGTGSYVADFITKECVAEIHLFDDDIYETHTAFRAPATIDIDTLRKTPKKVDFYASRFAFLRRGVFPHPFRVTAKNIQELKGLDFIFVCIDANPEKTTPY